MDGSTLAAVEPKLNVAEMTLTVVVLYSPSLIFLYVVLFVGLVPILFIS